jgi:very-short-patch-repair endonuclease
VNSRTKVCIICYEKDKNGDELGEHWILPLVHLKGGGNPRRLRGIKDENWEERICPICGCVFKERKKYSKITCSEECRKKYVEIHKDEINLKRSKSLKESFKKKTSEQIKLEHEKAKETNLLRYGETHFSKTKQGREMCSRNMKLLKSELDEKYKNEVLIPKYKQICEDDNLELIEFRTRFDCTVKCKKCGTEFVCKTLGYLTESTTTKRCRVCYPFDTFLSTTKFEDEFKNFINTLGVSYVKNNRSLIYPYEVDFYFPYQNVAVELDGLFWHCELKKDKNYHLMKTEKCYEKGIHLIHIFEDEWLHNRDICVSRIKNILGVTQNKIGARKCNVKVVSKKEEKEFLSLNHIQGYVSSTFSYGLYYNNELVSLMTFGPYRKNLGRKQVDGEYELLRFCNKLNYHVVGGASKLLKHFIKINVPKKLISYADRRWSNGHLYETLGFKFVRNTQPNYSYIFGTQRKNRFGFRKNVLVEKYGCPHDMSEREFCFQQKWYRIYDSGNKLYEMCIAPEGASFE